MPNHQYPLIPKVPGTTLRILIMGRISTIHQNEVNIEASYRRSLCYDRPARVSRKANQPKGSAVEMAEDMGIELLNEKEYRELQKLGEFDLRTSSWVKTPGEVRKLGGALFCDRRYGMVFVYHNGAQSWYAARGFRGSLRV